MKTIYLVEWTTKALLNIGQPRWQVHEAYLTLNAAEARVKELNTHDKNDIHRVNPIVLNEK